MPAAQNNSTSIQFFVDLCTYIHIVNPLIASNTTTNAVGCGEQSNIKKETLYHM